MFEVVHRTLQRSTKQSGIMQFIAMGTWSSIPVVTWWMRGYNINKAEGRKGEVESPHGTGKRLSAIALLATLHQGFRVLETHDSISHRK